MVLDQKRLTRQREGFAKWVTNLRVSPVRAGIMQYPTGFGKTFVAIMAIKAMFDKHPDRSTIVVVPTTKLKEDWVGRWEVDENTGKKTWVQGHIEKHGLQNVRVFVVNTYVRYVDWKCDLFILDEIHHYLSYESKFFSTVITITSYRFGMGLSATLNKNQQEIAESLGWNFVDIISDTEAEVEGYVSNSITYNLGIPLSAKDREFNDEINKTFNYYFEKFDYEFDLLKCCNIKDTGFLPAKTKTFGFLSSRSGKEWRLWWAHKKNWDGSDTHPYSPKNISKYAAQGMLAMGRRRQVLQNMPSKFEYIKNIVNRYPNLKTVIFSESSDFADKVAELFPGKSLSYHSNLVTLAIKGTDIIKNPSKDKKLALKADGYIIKGQTVLKREAIQGFESRTSPIKILSAVRALDEGFDVESIEFVLQAAYNSTERQNTQREGRGKRIDYNNLSKRTLIVNLYMKDTQEEKWLRSRQSGKRQVRWIESVDEVSINQKISLGDGPNRITGSQVSETETGVVSSTA